MLKQPKPMALILGPVLRTYRSSSFAMHGAAT